MSCPKNPKKFLRWKWFGGHNFEFIGWKEYMAPTGNYVNGEPIEKKMTCRKWMCSKCGLTESTDHMRDMFG